MSGLGPGEVLVHVPRKNMMQKSADVRVRTSQNAVITLSEWDAKHSRRVQALNEAHIRLWRLTVYVHPDVDEAQVAILRSAAAEKFGAPSRYVKPTAPGLSYLRAVFEKEADSNRWTLQDWARISDGKAGVAALSTAKNY